MKNDQLIPGTAIHKTPNLFTLSDLDYAEMTPMQSACEREIVATARDSRTYTYRLECYAFWHAVHSTSVIGCDTREDWRWPYLLNPDLAFGHFLARPCSRYGQVIDGYQVRLNSGDMVARWGIIVASRNKLQSHWDRFADRHGWK